MSEEDGGLPGDTERYLLPWYLSGTLSVRERRRITDHLGVCATCRRDLELLATVGAELRRAGLSLPEPSQCIVDSVRSRIQAHAAVANS